MLKPLLTIVGVVMACVGIVWILQGINVLPGSFMTGDLQWAIYGALTTAAGILLILWSRKRRA